MPTIEPVLSILIPALPSRAGLLAVLQAKLMEQVRDSKQDLHVEILALIDNKTRSIGLKRQALLDVARGKFIAFVDDDDDVADDYVASLLDAIAEEPDADVIVFNQTSYLGEAAPITIRFGLEYENEGVVIPGPDTFHRKPWHVCAWARRIAKRCAFPDASYGEDWYWAAQAVSLATKQFRIDRVLHVYRWKPSVTEAEHTFPPDVIPAPQPANYTIGGEGANDHPPEKDFSVDYAMAVMDSAIQITCQIPGELESILDVGSNIGQWTRAFSRMGGCSRFIVAVDAPDMAKEMMRGCTHFIGHDLRSPLVINFPAEGDVVHQFDLVLCLEVAEHLPEKCADILIDSLCRHGSQICFSAAEPGQGGHKHINEQPFSYWERKFADRGYTADLAIRDKLPANLPTYYKRMAIFRRA